MGKTIFFLHSAGPQGKGQGSYFLADNLRRHLPPDYSLVMPLMPDPENPDFETWCLAVDQALHDVKDGTILIGHSFGGSVLLKYLTEYAADKTFAGLFLIASPYWGAPDWEVEEFLLADDFGKRLPANLPVYIYHSVDDEAVPVEHLHRYSAELPQATARVVDHCGHLFGTPIPELIADIEQLPE